MKPSRPPSDDVLFISALAALLLGIGLLLYTTRLFVGIAGAWPVLVMAVGGILLYFALVRSASIIILFGGLLFACEGALFLVWTLAGWKLNQAWPLIMVMAGLAGIGTGFIREQGRKVVFFAPSFGFLGLGLFFALFSFEWITLDFSDFIAAWWPTVFIIGGVCLFIAYGFARQKARRGKTDVDSSDPGPKSRRTSGKARSPGP
jgi:hypothetical protein